MTKTDAKAWLKRFSDMPVQECCIHGHKECSITPAGPCLDDVIQAAMILEEPAKPD